MIKLSDGIQIISGLALLVGLALVYVEIRQTKELTRAQLVADSLEASLTRTLTFAGESPAEVIARVCESDAPPTLADAIALENIYEHFELLVIRTRELESTVGFGESRVARVGSFSIRKMLQLPYGRHWLEHNLALAGEDEALRYMQSVLNSDNPPIECSVSLFKAIESK